MSAITQPRPRLSAIGAAADKGDLRPIYAIEFRESLRLKTFPCM